MKPILEVQHIWKAYKIGGKQRRYLSLRDQLKNTFRAKSRQETFWALQDVAFHVYEGECIGIIGKNGAGKSTLLKILSKITPPTKGCIKVRGRIASLLEVGTGFHPELTGRENIYLNGSILGLRKVEIDKKFDEIVDFSGVEYFLDTPLKHYSSGMQLRLAFSVAAHLEPEILLIDEVLAVGDAEFQKKCLGKMDAVSKSGRTVIFVSHNLGAVKSLCPKAVLVNKGRVVNIGRTEVCIEMYLQSSTINNLDKVRFDGPMASAFELISIRINGLDTSKNLCFKPSEALKINVSFLTTFMKAFRVTFSLFKDNIRLFSLHDQDASVCEKEVFISIFELPPYLLRPGIYSIAIGGNDGRLENNWFWNKEVIRFEILEIWDSTVKRVDFGIINVKEAKTYRR